MGLRPLLVLALSALPAPADAGKSIAGVCPDGSAFIVQRVADVPCSRAKLVEPSSIPPLRPELLPRPYPWLVDQEARDPHNPYNLLEAAEAIRALRAGAAPAPTAGPAEAPLPSMPPLRRSVPAIAPEDVRALVEVVDLRQEFAPAQIRAEDALGRVRMDLRFAHSRAFEGKILGWLAQSREQSRVLLFSVRALEPAEFYPNFFFLQDAQGFRPAPAAPEEAGFLLGDPGMLDTGAVRLGYVVLPGRFNPERPMELWWNDLRVETILKP